MFTRFLLISIIIALYIGTELFLLEKLEKDLGGNMYSTQMEAAKKGIFTKEMEIVARDEQMSKEELMEKIAKGSIVRSEEHTSELQSH